MAWSLVQSKATGALADNNTTTFDSTPTEGNLLLASVHNTSSAVVPNISIGWDLIQGSTRSSLANALYARIAGPSETTSVSVDTGVALVGVNIYEFSGNQSTVTGIADQIATNNGAGATTTNGSQPSITTTVSETLVFVQLTLVNTITGQTLSDGTFTAGHAAPVGAIELVDFYKLDASIATYNPYFSWTTSRAWIQQISAIKPSSAGGGSSSGLLSIL